MGLHDSYTTARGQILMMNPWPTINQAYSLIKQEEKQRQTHNVVMSDSLAMALHSSYNSSLKPNVNPHFSGPSNSSAGTLECSYCHGDNHTQDKCFKLHGYPRDHPLHPANIGKKKPFGKGPYKSNYKGPRANSAIHVAEPVASNLPAPISQPSTDKTTIQGQMDTLQAQMSQLIQSFSQGKSTPEEHLAIHRFL